MINRIRALFDRSSPQRISKDPTIAAQKINEAKRLERNANITEISAAQTLDSIQDFNKPLGQLLISQRIINQEQVQSILETTHIGKVCLLIYAYHLKLGPLEKQPHQDESTKWPNR
jgi:hypothetical protein